MFAVTSLAEVWIEIAVRSSKQGYLSVTSLAEVWIEIAIAHSTRKKRRPVTSLAEVWIEISAGYW